MSTVTVQGLREQVRGQTITPGDSDYDEARRVYNAMIDRRPNVVVRASGADDVVGRRRLRPGERARRRGPRRRAQRARASAPAKTRS